MYTPELAEVAKRYFMYVRSGAHYAHAVRYLHVRFETPEPKYYTPVKTRKTNRPTRP